MFKHGHATRTEGETRTYRIWKNMRARCLRPTSTRYADYGGRGIVICPQWGNFVSFLADMGECPEGYSIERKDNNLGYYKGNCHWIPLEDQSRNRRVFKNNTSGVAGVSYFSRRGTWTAYIGRNGRRLYLGDFPTKEAAVEARKQAEAA